MNGRTVTAKKTADGVGGAPADLGVALADSLRHALGEGRVLDEENEQTEASFHLEHLSESESSLLKRMMVDQNRPKVTQVLYTITLSNCEVTCWRRGAQVPISGDARDTAINVAATWRR